MVCLNYFQRCVYLARFPFTRDGSRAAVIDDDDFEIALGLALERLDAAVEQIAAAEGRDGDDDCWGRQRSSLVAGVVHVAAIPRVRWVRFPGFPGSIPGFPGSKLGFPGSLF